MKGKLEQRLEPEYYLLKRELLFKKGFKLTKISYLFKVRDGDHNQLPMEYVSDANSGIRYLRAQDIKGDEIISENPVYISREYFKTIERSHIHPGEILFSIMATLGSIAVYPSDMPVATANRAIGILEPKRKINTLYIKTILNCNFGIKLFQSLKRGGLQKRINLSDLSNLKLPIPSIEIQNTIANIFEIEIKKRKQELLKAEAILQKIDKILLQKLYIDVPVILRKKIFYIKTPDVLVNRFDPFYHQPHFELYTKCIEKSKYPVFYLKNLIKFLESGSRPKGGVSHFEEGVLSLGGEHVNNQCEIDTTNPKFIPYEFHKDYLKTETKFNDILLVKDGATTGKIGIIKNKEHIGQNVNEHVFLIRANDKILPEYLLNYLNSSIGQAQLKRVISGATVTGLIKSVVRHLRVPLPDIKEQNEIVEEINKIRMEAKKMQMEADKEFKNAKLEIEKMILE